jgi:hypothetical protein
VTNHVLAATSGHFTVGGGNAALVYTSAIFPLALTETVDFSDTLTAAWTAYVSLAEELTLGVSPSDQWGWSPVFGSPCAIVDTITLTAVQALLWRPSGLINELLTITPTMTTLGVYNFTQREQAVLEDFFGLSTTAKLQDTLTFSMFMSVVQGLVVLEQLGLVDTSLASYNYSQSMTEFLALNEALAWFLGGNWTDTAMFSDTLTPVYCAGVLQSDTMSLSDAFADQLIVTMVMDENAIFSDSNSLLAIYNLALQDTLKCSIAYMSPGGGFTAWAMNSRTGAVTEYTNYEFNSFAKLGDVYLGANSSGLFELSGGSDAGKPIITDLMGGLLQLSGSYLTSFKAAYLGLRGKGDFFLKLCSGDEKEYVYKIRTHSLRTARVDIGKGLRSRYFTWELTSVGQNFDLDSIEFLPISSTRRV